jgi:hypothetical protein
MKSLIKGYGREKRLGYTDLIEPSSVVHFQKKNALISILCIILVVSAHFVSHLISSCSQRMASDEPGIVYSNAI